MRLADSLGRLGRELRSTGPRELVTTVVRDVDRFDVLTFASALAFQIFFAIIPLTLFGLGLAGGLGSRTSGPSAGARRSARRSQARPSRSSTTPSGRSSAAGRGSG